jgi:hypothetical protein
MSGPGESFGSASLHVGADGYVQCSRYPDTLPILTVNAGSMAVTITPARRAKPGPDLLAFAHELAAQAALFAAECERLCAAQHTEETACDREQPGAGAAA